ncbi:hypothetical protein [Natrinema versiforme]|uniref:Uncharacterized protein n=1 Tax=Natrinema versiforme JCM 10478 TaxID=1227496 RepID=L9Y487_9EURY|nr:hypothetical protein [Natrinema versiforme]ELY68880.1 hypothetical protein C489_05923 [Natrinema versiforme JCM 10478]
MAVYRIDADYNADGPVLTNSDEDFPARIKVATKDSFGELRLSRDDYASVLELVAGVVSDDFPDECEIDGGSVAINPAPPETEDTWELEIRTDGLHYKFTLSEAELGGLENLLRSVHPDHDPADNADVEVRA